MLQEAMLCLSLTKDVRTLCTFHGEHYPIQENSIAPAANMWTYPENGQTVHPQCHEALYYGDCVM